MTMTNNTRINQGDTDGITCYHNDAKTAFQFSLWNNKVVDNDYGNRTEDI